MNILYTTEATNRTPADAAKFFVTEYWAEPRKVAKLWTDEGRTFFNVKDGIRTYEIVTIPAKRFVSPAIYQITVLE